MRRLLVSVLAGASVLAVAAPAAAEPASPEERAAAIARPSVVFIEVRWHGWVRDPRTGEVFGGAEGYEAITSCSGVVVHEDGYVVTAGHCVDPGPTGGGGALIGQAVAELADVGRVGDPAVAAAQLAEHGVLEGAADGSAIIREVQVERVVAGSDEPEVDVAPATVVDLRPADAGDVAVLKVPRGRLPASAVADVDDLPPGTPVLAIGYPGAADRATDPGTEPTNKNGQISTRRTINDHPYYEVSAAASPGMSGGPVVDMDGRVIGLVAAAPAGETQSFNLITAATSVRGLLARKGITAVTSANDRNFAAGIDHYFAGDYDTAVAFLDAVLAATPNHQQAEEYRTRAAERSGGPDLLLVSIMVCAGVAVLAGGAGAMLLGIRRHTARVAGSDLPTPPFGIPAVVAPVEQPPPRQNGPNE